MKVISCKCPHCGKGHYIRVPEETSDAFRSEEVDGASAFRLEEVDGASAFRSEYKVLESETVEALKQQGIPITVMSKERTHYIGHVKDTRPRNKALLHTEAVELADKAVHLATSRNSSMNETEGASL